VSTWEDHTLACPGCAAPLAMRIARGLHVGRAPHVRDDVLARRLHRRTCACGTTVHATASYEYTDLARHQLVVVALADELPTWPRWEARLRETLRRLFERGSPHAHAFADGLRSRVVFGDEELREKLVLWTAALDDAVVECVKVQAFAGDPALAVPGSRLLVEAVGADDHLACAWYAPGAVAPSRAIVLPGAALRLAARDRSSLSSRFPELFEGGFVSVRKYFVPSDR
jgi:hypothetical protein